MLEKLFQHGALHTGAHLGFFSGVGLLLPTLGKAWELQIKPWLYSPYGFYIAIGLIIISIVLIGFLAGSVSRLMRSVGWLLLIPGILALVFAAFGEMQVYSWADNHITGFSVAAPAVHFLIEESVPQTAILGGFYILLGIGFLWVGRRISRVADYI
ncbi:hypothetical protein HY493_00840 [Candidatus Woesearchaeota archaeon]|nr:hypothetical protein [Candidatus Woesearchaeota archaeon]